MRVPVPFAIILVVAFCATTIHADIIWDWTYTSNIYTGSGTLTTQSTTTSDGSFTGYLIENMTGTWNGSLITGLSSPGNFGGNDNLLASAQPQLDGSGLTFTTATDQFNLFYSAGYITFGVSSPQDSGGVFSAVAAPEPATSLLMLTALALFAGYASRKWYGALPSTEDELSRTEARRSPVRLN